MSIDTMVEAMKNLDKGETIKKVALELHVGEVPVRDLCQNQAKIRGGGGVPKMP